MRGPHNIFRLIATGATLERTGAMPVILDAFRAPPLLRAVMRGLAWPVQWLGSAGDPTMPPVTRALTALGPAYIKFGQIMSTRPDVVGDELAMQLRVLQDKLPPFPMKKARRAIEDELEIEIEAVFEELSPPIAAASIAQVHKGVLKDGETVAVKVLRPGIERAFRRDIDAFYLAARMIETLAPAARRLRPLDVVHHFDETVQGELDFRLESAAASQFAANTRGDEGFSLPQIKWHLTGKRVMTQSWVEGIGAGDTLALDAAGHDRRALAVRVLQLFLNHALRDGYFHADMHQGNLKIAENGDIVAYDFGIMGTIDEYTRRVYAEILFGFIRKDYRRVAEVHFEAGYVPPDRDVEEFARALRSVGEPIFGMDASRISMGRLLAYLFDVTERFGMETRTELLLLQRTMVVVEGVARTLDPREMNIWEAARPVVEDYVRKNLGPAAFAGDLARTARVLARFGPRLPAMAEAALIDLNRPRTVVVPRRRWGPAMGFAALGAGVALAGVWLGTLI
ncbi:MAG: 2-polyprenylphenol 6-hydroxylase [Paracoccaceae bacterium]